MERKTEVVYVERKPIEEIKRPQHQHDTGETILLAGGATGTILKCFHQAEVVTLEDFTLVPLIVSRTKKRDILHHVTVVPNSMNSGQISVTMADGITLAKCAPVVIAKGTVYSTILAKDQSGSMTILGTDFLKYVGGELFYPRLRDVPDGFTFDMFVHVNSSNKQLGVSATICSIQAKYTVVVTGSNSLDGCVMDVAECDVARSS